MTAEARKKKSRLTLYIFVGMGLGLLIGAIFPDVGTSLRPLSQIFIRLIKSIIAPLIFATIVVGIAGHSDLKTVGRMGLKALIYFEVVTTIALFLGLVFVNIVKPGVGVHLSGGDCGASPPNRRRSPKSSSTSFPRASSKRRPTARSSRSWSSASSSPRL